MADPSMRFVLLGCSVCDDLIKLVERERRCECGRAGGRQTEPGGIETTGPARLFEIPWEDIDGARPGDTKRLIVLPAKSPFKP